LIGFFPEVYPDELLYSVFARYQVYCGYTGHHGLYPDIFIKNEKQIPFRLTAPINNDVKEAIGNFEDVIHRHTLIDYYIRFISRRKRERALKSILSDDAIDTPLSFIVNSDFDYNALYCPLCAKADRDIYGETYWHRSHQYRGIDVCHIHGCYLMNYKLTAQQSVSAEAVIPTDDIVCYSPNEPEFALAGYVAELMNKPLINKNISVSEYLKRKAEYSQYYSVFTKRVDFEKMSNGLAKFYKGMQSKYFAPQQLLKVFVIGATDFAQVCAIALFLGVSVDELNNMLLPTDNGINYNKLHKIV